MKKHRKKILKKRIIEVSMAVAVVLLVGLVGFFVYGSFSSNSSQSEFQNFLVGNKFFSFKLQTPKGWIAKEKTAYSEASISYLFPECTKSGPIEVGDFKFEDQRRPDNFGDMGYFSDNSKTGIILEVKVYCVSGGGGNYTGMEIGGEKTSVSSVDLLGFGKTKTVSFLHNNLKYEVNELVYISPADKVNEEKIREEYNNEFDKILSSFIFVK